MKTALLVPFQSRRLKTVLLSLAIAGSIFGVLHGQAETGAHRLFDEGNILYQQEDFATALQKYHQVESLDLISSPLYFNIGNSYYKLEQIGRAILYYERALLLDPKNEDALANLAIANQATVDKITPPPEFALASWLRWTLYRFPISTLLRILSVIYLLLGGLVIALVLTRPRRLRSVIKKICLVTLLLLFVTAVLFLAQWQDSRNRVEAIVLVEELPAMDAPGEGGTEVFSIHEGAKVRIDQTSNGSVEIVLPDGKIGWVSSDGIEII